MAMAEALLLQRIGRDYLQWKKRKDVPRSWGQSFVVYLKMQCAT
jgi:hypothetical protein